MILINMPLEHLRELKTVVALLTFEHLKTQKLVVSKHYFLACPYLRLFFTYLYMCICIGEALFWEIKKHYYFEILFYVYDIYF